MTVSVSRVERLVLHFRRERGWTRELVGAIPEPHFDWAPAPDAFTCGGLVVHLIQSEVFWRRLLVAASRGEAFDPFRLPGTPRERLDAFRGPNLGSSRSERFGGTFAQCLESWTGIEEKTAVELSAIPETALEGVEFTHPLTGLHATLGEMFLVFLGHEGHHRGQLSAYLKMLREPQPVLFT